MPAYEESRVTQQHVVPNKNHDEIAYNVVRYMLVNLKVYILYGLQEQWSTTRRQRHEKMQRITKISRDFDIWKQHLLQETFSLGVIYVIYRVVY